MPQFVVEGRSAKTGRKLKRQRTYNAVDETAARELAKADGMLPDAVSLVDLKHLVREIAGVSHKNADNTSRQKILKSCRVGETLALEHEEGNRHDQNAIRVLKEDGRQIGYLPRDVASWAMEWYKPGEPPNYSATIVEIENYRDFLTPEILVVLALPSVSAERFREYVAREKCSRSVDPLDVAPPRSLQSRPRRTPEWARSPGERALGRSERTGCLTAIAIVVLILVGLVWSL